MKNALAGLVVLGAVGGGVAYTATTVDRADRSAPTVVWEQPTATATPEDPAAGIDKGRASTPLSKLLLPVPDGYVLGAEIEGHGNDAELEAAEATALFKQTAKGVYGKGRRAFEEAVDGLGVQGMAFRSYARVDGSLHAEVSILRMKDRKAVRTYFDSEKRLAGLLDLDKGPKIKDHERNAVCYLGPKPEKPREKDGERRTPKLRLMHCTAYDGEVMVNVSAYGIPPLDTQAVATLVERQLRHIESPGEYV
nr:MULTISPECIES: hypothetical protein [unclassified Streptomyces]